MAFKFKTAALIDDTQELCLEEKSESPVVVVADRGRGGDGAPGEWRDSVLRLRAMPVPRGFLDEHWLRIVSTSEAFLDRWGATAHDLGWTTEEIFGVHAGAPLVRCGSMGLMVCAADAGTVIENLDGGTAIIHTKRGAIQRFRRSCFNLDSSPLRLLWDF